MPPRETFQGHHPVVHTETAQIERRIDLSGGLKIYGFVTFEATIRWLRISRTKVQAIAEDGTVLRTCDGSSDFSGLLHSTIDMPRRVEEMCRLFSVDTHSALRVEARLKVTNHPAIYAYDENGTPTYHEVPLDWRYVDAAGSPMSGAFDMADHRSAWITPKTIVDQPLWTSRDLTASARDTTYEAAIAATLHDLPVDLMEKVRNSLSAETKRLARAA